MISWKNSNQLQYVPKRVFNLPQLENGGFVTTSRPLHHYRYTGMSINLQQPFTTSCAPCTTSNKVGVPYKMIGKNDKGVNLYDGCCIPGPVENLVNGKPTRPARGDKIDFSGKATIRTARASGYTEKPYYANNYAYLYSRGKTYITKSVLGKKVEGTLYKEGLNSEACTIYNPSNKPFKTQGAVDSSTLVARLNYNTIVQNNLSFYNTYKTRFTYTDNPIFFIKDKMNKCPECIRTPSTNYNYSDNYMNNINYGG
jgi:hypothetical protein